MAAWGSNGPRGRRRARVAHLSRALWPPALGRWDSFERTAGASGSGSGRGLGRSPPPYSGVTGATALRCRPRGNQITRPEPTAGTREPPAGAAGIVTGLGTRRRREQWTDGAGGIPLEGGRTRGRLRATWPAGPLPPAVTRGQDSLRVVATKAFSGQGVTPSPVLHASARTCVARAAKPLERGFGTQPGVQMAPRLRLEPPPSPGVPGRPDLGQCIFSAHRGPFPKSPMRECVLVGNRLPRAPRGLCRVPPVGGPHRHSGEGPKHGSPCFFFKQ